MLRHAAASTVIEYAYNDKAVLGQRLMLTEELYGNTFTVCKVHTRADLGTCSWHEVTFIYVLLTLLFDVQSSACNTIEKVVEENPDKLNSIIDEMKQILTPMAQK